MATHDQNIADQAGLPMRTDVNLALASAFSSSSNPTTPTTTRAGMLWFDTHSTTISTVWIRNNANTAWIRMFDLSDTGITAIGFSNLDDVKTINGGPLAGYRNAIINGDFDIWQRAITQSASGTLSDDKWGNTHSVSTKTIDRMVFAVGQTDVPGDPKYYSRVTVLTTGNTTSNYVVKEHRVEGVQTFSGKTVTVTLYAKADAPKNMAVEFGQSFGSGGSPSGNLSSIGMTTLSLTTAWRKYSFAVALPSITGKVLGTNNNDYLRMTLWFDGGTNYDVRNNGLGSQTGVFDVAHISLVEGDATQEDDPFSPRFFEQELQLAQRYYEASYALETLPGTITSAGSAQQNIAQLATSVANGAIVPILFRTRKRATPTMALYSPMTGASGFGTSWYGTNTDVAATATATGEHGSAYVMNDTRSTTFTDYTVQWTASSEV